ncbi:hypothetical protein TSUD_301100 [Trifolium subterraneum]|uniref:Uncharacterized protein n=1 Tax=Trifolium subterraneum TaxID=3900 RepID=A0A2Z6PJK3_TRISU|nr:hypothetical protein TSUD_301100 [Trifolium subterraneum]
MAVARQVPYALDILLAELHRVCIYTIPMHLVYRKLPSLMLRIRTSFCCSANMIPQTWEY